MRTCLFGSGIVGRAGQMLLYCCPQKDTRVFANGAREASLDCRVNLGPAPLQKPPPPVYIGTLSTGATTVDLDHVYEHRAFSGTPDQCIANIQRLQEQGIDYFGCNFAFSRMEHDKVMRAMQLFATEVMPHFI